MALCSLTHVYFRSNGDPRRRTHTLARLDAAEIKADRSGPVVHRGRISKPLIIASRLSQSSLRRVDYFQPRLPSPSVRRVQQGLFFMPPGPIRRQRRHARWSNAASRCLVLKAEVDEIKVPQQPSSRSITR